MKKISVALLSTFFAATIIHNSWAIGDVNVEGIKEVSLPGMDIGVPQSQSLDVSALSESFPTDEGILDSDINKNLSLDVPIQSATNHIAQTLSDKIFTEKMGTKENKVATPRNTAPTALKSGFAKRTAERLKSIAHLAKNLAHSDSSKVSLDQFFENSKASPQKVNLITLGTILKGYHALNNPLILAQPSAYDMTSENVATFRHLEGHPLQANGVLHAKKWSDGLLNKYVDIQLVSKDGSQTILLTQKHFSRTKDADLFLHSLPIGKFVTADFTILHPSFLTPTSPFLDLRFTQTR